MSMTLFITTLISYLTSYMAVFLLLCFFVSLFFLTRLKRKIPPGSLGIPIIGQSFEFFSAMKSNKAEEWLNQRIQKYGPVSKLHLFGTPTIFINGQAAHKFVYTCNDKILANRQPSSVMRIVGQRSIAALSGDDHKRIRGALVSFMKPEALKQSVSKIDEEVRIHLNNHWHGKDQIQVMPLMKTLTFNIVCTLILGIERGAIRDTLVHLLEVMIEGAFALPINLPFMRFNRGLSARSKVKRMILELMHEKRKKLERNRDNISDADGHQDLITCWLSMRDETDSPLLSDEEIVDNCIVVMMTGYDTTAIVLTFLIKLMAENASVRENILKEVEEVTRGKTTNKELFNWEDLGRMKYTWRVTTELMRMNPPVLCSFRQALKDIEFGGYVIPKGWQVMWAGCMTHMNESIFEDPLKFDPSRFENNKVISAYSFIAFGGGPRMCPAYELARIESLVLIRYLVTGFNWKLSSKENIFGRDPMPVFFNGLPINIEPRKPNDHHNVM